MSKRRHAEPLRCFFLQRVQQSGRRDRPHQQGDRGTAL